VNGGFRFGGGERVHGGFGKHVKPGAASDSAAE